VVVDFAHNPAALDSVLSLPRTARERRRILVFGCEGLKDRSKRPIMGRIAAERADHCIITSDNTYDEDPLEIAREIERGIVEAGKREGDGYQIVLDRCEAIRRGIEMAGHDTTVIIAGRRHETHQVVGGRRIPLDDRQVASEILGGSGAAAHSNTDAGRPSQ